jgi:tRNA (mo5U34)-methyltransferase
MIGYQNFYQSLQDTPLSAWRDELFRLAEAALHDRRHGKMPEWSAWLAQLPAVQAADVDLGQDAVRIGAASEIDVEQRRELEQLLRRFHPWRKGPFSVFGIDIDTEWRSDWKWQRLRQQLTPLQDRVVLDVGCGSGYHLLRMLADGARLAVGIDPTMLYVMQFHALKHFIPDVPAYVLPLRGEDMPHETQVFDTVFSMGVLYHCRSPFDHLRELKGQLRPGGELVLETLVIDGGPLEVLVPQGRYAKMRNVWFIPSCDMMHSWLIRAGFAHVRLVDMSVTRPDEQRATEWMTFESLQDFLDPNDQTLTVEGYPAPRRAVFIAGSI